MDKYFHPASKESKGKTLTFITTYYPDLLDDIREYANQQGVDAGDIAILTITDIVIPSLHMNWFDILIIKILNIFESKPRN